MSTDFSHNHILEHEERDLLLWSYLHNEISSQDKTYVEQMIASNIEWKNAWKNIQAEEVQFSLLETEMPSMRFSKNIMESIDQKVIVPPVKSYVNKTIARIIGCCFVLLILGMLVWMMTQVRWSSTSNNFLTSFSMPKLSIDWTISDSNYWLYIAFAIILVCFFVFIESFLLDKRRKYKTQ